MSREQVRTIDISLEKAIQRAIGLGEQLTDEQKRRILEDRARVLAQPISDSNKPSGDMMRVLTFKLGGENYAFPAASVFSVNKSIPITPVPCVPSFVDGITN
ncbi:MAG TPA: chemotaxis protein CheW, partial [Aggregatilineales bacterium]|nr:chemotaxis protein CheW [Aggregatilineales bacterium]